MINPAFLKKQAKRFLYKFVRTKTLLAFTMDKRKYKKNMQAKIALEDNDRE